VGLGYLQGLGALDETGLPLHVGGISVTHPGLVYVGLEFQRSFSSNTLRGVHRDAEYVVRPLAAHVSGVGAVLGA
jgi:putative flavoprotein involved in K+ transport